MDRRKEEEGGSHLHGVIGHEPPCAKGSPIQGALARLRDDVHNEIENPSPGGMQPQTKTRADSSTMNRPLEQSPSPSSLRPQTLNRPLGEVQALAECSYK